MIAFVTGATGFVGRRTLEAMLAGPFEEIRCLVRDPSRLPDDPRLRAVRGALPDDLAAADEALPGCDVVVHLAAVTGRATADDHQAVSVSGTEALLRLASTAGVRRFLFVSTIAVKYPEKKHYPYAAAKQEAERLVRESGLDVAVLRPTVVLGPGSAVEAGIVSLACAPVLPRFDGGRASVQPVHVDDVAAAVAHLAARPELGGATIDFGGPEAMTWDELLRRVRRTLTGGEGPSVPVPLAPVVAALAGLERVLPGPPPVTAGQFYAFRHDGLAAPDDSVPPAPSERRSVDDRLAERRAEAAAPPEEAERLARLDRECSVFTRYLARADAGDELRAHYRRAHEAGRCHPVPPDAPDDPVVAYARRGPWQARLADVYASRFDRSGPLRRKLVLLLAMLESIGETNHRLDGPTAGSFAGFVLGAAARGVAYAVMLPAAMLLVGRARKRAGIGR